MLRENIVVRVVRKEDPAPSLHWCTLASGACPCARSRTDKIPSKVEGKSRTCCYLQHFNDCNSVSLLRSSSNMPKHSSSACSQSGV